MQQEYATVKRFAELAGVTTQYIYKRMKTDLQPYIKLDGNKKTIDTRALALFETIKPATVEKLPTNDNDNFLKQQLEEKSKVIDRLLSHIEMLDNRCELCNRVETEKEDQKQLDTPSQKKWWVFWK